MEATGNGKRLRRRLQRQLEFYMSESNLRQDKFLNEHMDEEGYVPAELFLSFNRVKSMQATERMILQAASKSTLLRADEENKCIAPAEMPTFDDDPTLPDRTLYIENFRRHHDHTSLRQLLSKFGKVNLVSLPRFAKSRQFKGFGFVEFASEESAATALEAILAEESNSDAEEEVHDINAMTKRRWLELREQLKNQLQPSAAEHDAKARDELPETEMDSLDVREKDGTDRKHQRFEPTNSSDEEPDTKRLKEQ